MSIHSIASGYAAQELYGPRAKNGGVRRKEADVSAPRGAQVELSDASASFRKVKEAVDRLPDVRIALVEEIKQKIELNDYPIENNLNETVKKLMEEQVVLP